MDGLHGENESRDHTMGRDRAGETREHAKTDRGHDAAGPAHSVRRGGHQCVPDEHRLDFRWTSDHTF